MGCGSVQSIGGSVLYLAEYEQCFEGGTVWDKWRCAGGCGIRAIVGKRESIAQRRKGAKKDKLTCFLCALCFESLLIRSYGIKAEGTGMSPFVPNCSDLSVPVRLCRIWKVAVEGL